jgi:ornithine cyclodeaminase/alanine dehydrogenase-like protein (mu-crystallin family)
MALLVLSGAAVRQTLGFASCADAMRGALAARARGEVFQPLRSVLRPEGAAGLMALMPSYQSGPSAAAGYGLKAICITPGNPAIGLDSHQGIVLLSSADTGQPLAVLNASAVTEIRTAAVSAVATSLLARPDADVLAIVGTGVQARAHLAALAATRQLAQVRVAGSSAAKAAAFVADVAPAALEDVGISAVSGVPVVACDSVRDAVDGAGIVVTATSSQVPVLRREWLTSGVHINAVGACLPHARELDTPTVAEAAVFADSRESLLAESGDYLLAAAESGIGPDHVRAEIGDLLADLAPGAGRRSGGEITVFESLGLAVEDLAAAFVAYDAARESGTGTWIDFD